jgi:hypothetical protein
VIGTLPSYVTLMASLPAVGPLLTNKAPPINEVRLKQRLKWLTPEDQTQVETLRSLLAWTRLDMGETDEAFLARAHRLLREVRSESLRAAVRDRLEIRTLLAAMRRRHAGEEAPPPGTAWGFGRFVATIRANWGAPDFGVGRAFPWVLAARERLEADDRPGLERIILDAAWAAGERHLGGHDFDLEAVAWYLARWSLVDRWARYDADAAAERFAELLDDALTDSPSFLAAA